MGSGASRVGQTWLIRVVNDLRSPWKQLARGAGRRGSRQTEVPAYTTTNFVLRACARSPDTFGGWRQVIAASSRLLARNLTTDLQGPARVVTRPAGRRREFLKSHGSGWIESVGPGHPYLTRPGLTREV